VVARARERLSVRKRGAQMFDMERRVVRKPNEAEITDKYLLRISSRFAAFKKFDDSGDINRPVKTFAISVTES
jgi:sigma54-dependent transcription regulator